MAANSQPLLLILQLNNHFGRLLIHWPLCHMVAASMMPGYDMAMPEGHVMDISVAQILQGKI